MIEFIYLFKLNIFIDFFLVSISGFLLWLSVYFYRNYWIENIYVLLIYILLPTSIYVITKVISGNIALALGMVGALSIVRFRNPVKNPFDLVMYFVLITQGITYSVNRPYGILFTIFVMGVLIFFLFIRAYLKVNFGIKNSMSGSGMYSLIVESDVKIDFEKYSNLLSEKNSFLNNDEYYYRLSSNNKQQLIEIEKYLIEKKDIFKVKSVQIDFNES